jgi:8-oxo-dGTP diphosphatase
LTSDTEVKARFAGGGWPGCQTVPVREWLVAGALIEGPEGILLVQNRRRNGSLDWSPPGGVIDPGESVREGLAREVEEETGLVVTEWDGPVYSVEATSEAMGWHMSAEVHRAVAYRGRLRVDDPDGIVVDARFVAVEGCHDHLDACHPWVREPLLAWLADRAVDAADAVDVPRWRYQVTDDGVRRLA